MSVIFSKESSKDRMTTDDDLMNTELGSPKYSEHVSDTTVYSLCRSDDTFSLSASNNSAEISDNILSHKSGSASESEMATTIHLSLNHTMHHNKATKPLKELQKEWMKKETEFKKFINTKPTNDAYNKVKWRYFCI